MHACIKITYGDGTVVLASKIAISAKGTIQIFLEPAEDEDPELQRRVPRLRDQRMLIEADY